jgi:hypothetical protein
MDVHNKNINYRGAGQMIITVRYHYNHQDNMEMKCADVLFGRSAFEGWKKRMGPITKNVSTIPPGL